MALLQGTLMANAAIDIKASESGKFRAMAGIALIVINNSIWVDPAKRWEKDKLRKGLEDFAITHGGMPLTTWQAYAKGVDTIAGKMGDNLQGLDVVCGEEEIDFDGIADMPEGDAVTALVKIFTAYGVSSGGQIRDWARQEGFAPFDADRVKRERKAKQEAERAAKAITNSALLMGVMGRDSSSLPETLPNQDLVTPTGIAGILAALAALTGAERLEAMAGLNAMLEADAVEAAKMDGIQEEEPPMLQDHVEDEVTIPNKKRRARAVKLADMTMAS